MPTALVTGGNRGIGQAIVVALARRGFHVAFVDLTENEDTNRTRAAVQKAGGQSTFIRGDIADVRGHDSIVQRAWEIEERLDVLVNNAGVPAPCGETCSTSLPTASTR